MGTGACAPNREARVACVIDGDTVDVDACGDEVGERIRLLGIDAPETAKEDAPAECWANEAREELRRLVDSRTVTLTFDSECTGAFGRTLAYVWLSDDEDSLEGALLVNEKLLQEGWVRLYDEDWTGDLRLQERLEAAEAEARSRGLGLWSACGSET